MGHSWALELGIRIHELSRYLFCFLNEIGWLIWLNEYNEIGYLIKFINLRKVFEDIVYIVIYVFASYKWLIRNPDGDILGVSVA